MPWQFDESSVIVTWFCLSNVGLKSCAHAIALKTVLDSGSRCSAEAFGSLVPTCFAVEGSYSSRAGDLLVSSGRMGFLY